jgi:DNA processing protein
MGFFKPSGETVSSTWAGALRLKLTPGLGLRRCRLLLDAMGGCEQVLQAPDDLLRGVLGVSLWESLRQPPAEWEQARLRIMDWVSQAPEGIQHTVLAWGDPAYPAALVELPDPPLLLFVAHPEDDPLEAWPASLAVVGSRGATPQGMALAQRWSQELADAGWCVASGLARGIDAAAHTGALQSVRQGCLTLAAMATGPDRVYPAEHAPLKMRITARGRCVSEQLPQVAARPMHFPLRNRLLAALSSAVLVIEADLRSGSLISAQCALDQGRDVMAVPGSVLSPQSRGCHALIRQGATLVTDVAEVLQALPRFQSSGHAPAAPTPADFKPTDAPHPVSASPDPHLAAIQAALGHDPVPVDILLQRLSWPVAETRSQLQALEWQGLLARLPGDRVQWLYK